MTRTTSLRFAALIFAALLATLFPALADDPIVKVAPTPTPAAGPTVKAADAVLRRSRPAKPTELIERYSTKPGLKQVYTSAEYVALQR